MRRLPISKRQILQAMVQFSAATAGRNMTKAAYAAVTIGVAVMVLLTVAPAYETAHHWVDAALWACWAYFLFEWGVRLRHAVRLERVWTYAAFGSGPATMWWAVVTLTTVGYGDVVPVTVLGRLVAAMVMISGLGVFGLWTGILATGFAAETRRDNFLKTWDSVSKVPFFAALGPSAIADVTHMLRTMDLPPRTMIIRKGQAGDCMYFIAAGEGEVDLPGKKVRLSEGAFFGEMALLGNNLRSANITTTRLSKLLVLDLVDFRLLMARHPDLAQTIDAEAKRRALENK